MPDEMDRVQEINEEHLADAIADHYRHRVTGVSRTHCLDCEEPIPEARQKAVKGCQRCVTCQTVFENGGAP